MFKKTLVPCTPERVNKALEGFKAIEYTLERVVDPSNLDTFTKVSEMIWGNMFAEFDLCELIPKHGPGATAERISGNQKFVHRRWHERLQPFFPFDSFACFNVEHAEERLRVSSVSFPTLEEEQPVRVIPVPKTLKGPRIIAIEPVCNQYTQQALARYIVNLLETDGITRGHINFSDQSVNQRLAVTSSRDKAYACIDLSSASDRVPLELVLHMLKSTPILEPILACRSRRATLPDGVTLLLNKFASMGSALCFPVQAMYYFSIIVACLLDKRNMPVTLRNIKAVSRSVYVYGDDIFVPTHEVEDVIEYLSRYYCKVNAHKSFWKSNFRESCGMDAYGGENVTPVYVRTTLPDDMDAVKEIESTISTCNQLYLKGYWHASEYLKDYIQNLMEDFLPVIADTSPALGLVSYQGIPPRKLQRASYIEDINLQCVLIYAPVVVQDEKTDAIGGYNAMMKWILDKDVAKEPKASKLPTELSSVDRFISTPKSGTSRIKYRWTREY
jgi:hypothetical protein